MNSFRLILPLFALPAFAADASLDSLLKAVERRYNSAKTLQVQFHEVYSGPGRPKRAESGTLMLRKPGRMRWEYSQPEGKLFLSDGKELWLYLPASNRVEKMKMKESDDMRAPLAFLLGRLSFRNEFKRVEARMDAGGTLVAAIPKSDNLPYTHVEFLVAANHEINRVRVTGYDKSVLDFTFSGEKMNPPLAAGLFQFRMPAGAELVEAGQ